MTRCCLELVFVFTVEILGSGSMSTVVSGSGDVGPVTASGSSDIIIVTAGSGTSGGGVCLRGQSSELQLGHSLLSGLLSIIDQNNGLTLSNSVKILTLASES